MQLIRVVTLHVNCGAVGAAAWLQRDVAIPRSSATFTEPTLDLALL